MITVTPNLFAYFMLALWPLVAVVLYARLPFLRATVWTVLGAYLLLPVRTEIKFSGVPTFDKTSIPSIAVAVCCVLVARRRPKIFLGLGIAEVLLMVLVSSPFITALLNPDPVDTGTYLLPGSGPYDALSSVVAQLLLIFPFFIARQFFRSLEDSIEIFRIMVVAGLAYSVLMLFEIRMSPQLHVWVYGYFPHVFSQMVRDGGFRPVVFLGHGLLVAFFCMTTVVAAAALWRAKIRVARMPPGGGITGYLSFVLLLCKTTSATVYALVLVPLVRWATPRLQLRVAVIFVAIALTYPVVRAADMFPTSYILKVAYAVDVDRGKSLETRFTQEGQLLEKAWRRRWFGWGRFGRGRIYYKGRDITISDGYWIITFGEFGIIGFIATFGLLSLTVLRAAGALKLTQNRRERELLGALSLIVAISLLNQLPNSSMSPWLWLLAGSLLGRAEQIYATVRKRAPAAGVDLSPVGVPERPGPAQASAFKPDETFVR